MAVWGLLTATVEGILYPFWMQDGALAGARFDKAIDAETDYAIGSTDPAFKVPTLSANDADTVANEQRTHLIVTGTDDTGKGMFSLGALLGSGTASDAGKNFVAEAVTKIEKVRADVSALLALDTKPDNLDTILTGQWNKLKLALDDIFGTTSTGDNANPAVRASAPREEDILDDIADILDALSSEANFVAATHGDRDNRGVFASQALGAGAAADAFNRLMWTAEATMGMTGSTRYGTAMRKKSDNAKMKPGMGEYGAFSYATMQETQRTADAAAVSLTGIASYSGGTRAVSGSGKAYSGTMDLQVRFKANSVSGVVSGLEDSEGLPWQHNFADVDRIVLDDGTLQRNAKWNNAATRSNQNATVFYAANSGLLRPVDGINNTFAGILLGRGADAGSEANGTWSVGTAGGTGYLAGGFGVEHVADTARPVPLEDDGSNATATLFTDGTPSTVTNATVSASIADGMLTVKARKYGYSGTSSEYGALSEAGDNGAAIKITAKFDLAAMADKAAGAATTVNGPTWLAGVIATLEKERDLLSTLQGLKSDDTQAAERLAWKRVQHAVQYRLLGALPAKLNKKYDTGDEGSATPLESEAEALDLIDRALDALSSNAKLGAALDPDGTGIFDHKADGSNFVNAAKDKVGGRTFAQIRGEKEHKVIATLGTTSYTRFGAWRREGTQRAVRTGGVKKDQGGPGTFAYSPLDPTNVGTPTNPGFPKGGSASYTGETVAIQNTTTLTGTVRVDVSWNSLTNSENGLSSGENPVIAEAGKMSLTISGLASAAGDPLTFGGTTEAKTAGVVTTPGVRPTHEIADIVFPEMTILVGKKPYAGNMIVGMAGDSADANGNFTYTEVAVSSERYRTTTASTDITEGVDGGKVKALFVGQGVDGPLGVIGTWTLDDDDVGRMNAAGTFPVDKTAVIHGAFGAELP